MEKDFRTVTQRMHFGGGWCGKYWQGCFTPGTLIPIISEAQARAMNPDYFMVLPWHFKNNTVARETDYLKSGGKLFFPLPELETVEKR